MAKIPKNCKSLKEKMLFDSSRAAAKKTRGEDLKVTSIMLLKTHVVKMSEIGFSIICMIEGDRNNSDL